MNFIQKWIHNYKWKNFDKKLFQNIVMEFVRNGYKVDIPYEGFKKSRLDLRVKFKKTQIYFRFTSGGLLGFGAINYLCDFVKAKKEIVFLVVSEDISEFEYNALNKQYIKVMVAPTIEDLYKAVHHQMVFNSVGNKTCVG
jgi:hypothetical protein